MLGLRDAHTHPERPVGLGARPWGSAPRPVPSRGSNGLHVVGGEHPRVPRALHRAVHPPVIDLLHVDDGVTVLEGDLILIGCVVVIDSAETLLWGERGQWAQSPPCAQWARSPITRHPPTPSQLLLCTGSKRSKACPAGVHSGLYSPTLQQEHCAGWKLVPRAPCSHRTETSAAGRLGEGERWG